MGPGAVDTTPARFGLERTRVTGDQQAMLDALVL
jgi:hypothetical protein